MDMSIIFSYLCGTKIKTMKKLLFVLSLIGLMSCNKDVKNTFKVVVLVPNYSSISAHETAVIFFENTERKFLEIDRTSYQNYSAYTSPTYNVTPTFRPDNRDQRNYMSLTIRKTDNNVSSVIFDVTVILYWNGKHFSTTQKRLVSGRNSYGLIFYTTPN